MYFSLNFIAMKKDNLIMGLNQIELLSIEDTKRKRISFTGVSRLSLIIIVFQRLCANWGQGVSACKKKAATRLFVTAWFSLFCILWTSLGLNQGPPDYESQIFDFQRFVFYIFSYPYILISKPKDNISFSNNISCFLLFS